MLDKKLTRIGGNTSDWVLPNILRLEQLRNTKFDKNVSGENLRNAAKWQSYSFYRLNQQSVEN